VSQSAPSRCCVDPKAASLTGADCAALVIRGLCASKEPVMPDVLLYPLIPFAVFIAACFAFPVFGGFMLISFVWILHDVLVALASRPRVDGPSSLKKLRRNDHDLPGMDDVPRTGNTVQDAMAMIRRYEELTRKQALPRPSGRHDRDKRAGSPPMIRRLNGPRP
jgi:hypothetical protein